MEKARTVTSSAQWVRNGCTGKLYLFGGWDGQKFLASVYEYDPSLDKWLERTPMPTARGLEGATEAEGSIYVIGGYDGKAVLAVNEIYLPEHNTWSKGVPLPVGRYAMGVASIADIIHIIGGSAIPQVLRFLWNIFLNLNIGRFMKARLSTKDRTLGWLPWEVIYICSGERL